MSAETRKERRRKRLTKGRHNYHWKNKQHQVIKLWKDPKAKVNKKIIS